MNEFYGLLLKAWLDVQLYVVDPNLSGQSGSLNFVIQLLKTCECRVHGQRWRYFRHPQHRPAVLRLLATINLAGLQKRAGDIRRTGAGIIRCLLPAHRDRPAVLRHAAYSRLLPVEELVEHRLQLRIRPPVLGPAIDR